MREIALTIVFVFIVFSGLWVFIEDDRQTALLNGTEKAFCGSPATGITNIQKVSTSYIYYFKDDQDTLLSEERSNCVIIKIKDPLRGQTCVLQTQ